jgi:drug/metabolite transporter (DMT)-like permease
VLYALVLASAFLHALWNALAKRARDPRHAVPALIAVSGLLAGVVAAVQLARGHAGLGWHALAFSALAGLFEARYFRALGRALAAGPLGPVYTLSRGGALLLVWPISALWLQEPVTALRAAGALLVLAGLAAASLERGLSAIAVRHALECAALIAAYHFAYKLALADGALPAAVFATSIGLATVLDLATGGGAHRRGVSAVLRGEPARTWLGGAVCAAAFLLFLVCLAQGGAAWVFTLRNTSVLFAAALSLALGERPTARQLGGAALVFAGALVLGPQ